MSGEPWEIGTRDDPEATGRGGVIGILKRLRTILGIISTTVGNMVPSQLYGYDYHQELVLPLAMVSGSGKLIAADEIGAHIHAGVMYECSGRVDAANGVTTDLLLTTPDSDLICHLYLEVDSEAECSYLLYEATTEDGDGVLQSCYNRNRNSDNVPTACVHLGPTVTVVGTLIRTRHWAGKKATEATVGRWDTVLLPNTKYLVRIKNETAAANYTNWILRWVEHEELNT